MILGSLPKMESISLMIYGVVYLFLICFVSECGFRELAVIKLVGVIKLNRNNRLVESGEFSGRCIRNLR